MIFSKKIVYFEVVQFNFKKKVLKSIVFWAFSRESKYEIRVLRVVACVRKFLYTVTQKMRVYKLKLAKLTKNMA